MADSYRYVVADVFTSTPLAGNQLAVFTDARGLDDATMQALALEIGFSETVFVLPAAADGTARIRIFNPRHEMPFAGHPTLGTAFVLAAPLQLGVIRLETGVGTVPVADRARRVGPDRLRSHDAAGAARRARRATGAGSRSRRRRSARCCRSSSTTTARDTSSCLVEERELGALRPDREAIAELGGHGRQLRGEDVRRVAVPDVLGARRGPGHGVGRRPDRLPPRPARPRRRGATRS